MSTRLTKIEQFRLDLAAEKAAAPIAPKPAAVPTGPNKYTGMDSTRRKMALENIIADPEQPRKEFDAQELADLAATIQTHGVLQPISVRWDERAGRWVIIAGERRVRAAGMAGLTEIPCIFYGLTDQPDMDRDRLDEIQIIENIHRVGLKPSEQAAWIRRYMARDPRRTQKDIAAKVRLSETTISNVLAVAGLPKPILDLVEAGMIAVRVGAELAAIEDPVEQAALAQRIVAAGLTKDEAIATVKAARPKKKRSRNRPSVAKAKNVQEQCTLTMTVDEGVTWTLKSRNPLLGSDVLPLARRLVEFLEVGQAQQQKDAA